MWSASLRPGLRALAAAGAAGACCAQRPRDGRGGRRRSDRSLLLPARRGPPARCVSASAPPAQSSLRGLYAEIEPTETGMLKTADGTHQLYYEVSGNPNGQPAIFFHGGPGDGSGPSQRRFFDPAVYRIVVFDQRGAGKSMPTASLEENTTQKLVEDCEQLREHLGIHSWAVAVGGSWGSTLALAYAEAYPKAVQRMVLYSIFLPSRRSIDWMYREGGASTFYPDAYHKFISHLPPDERNAPVESYHRRLRSADNSVRMAARSSLLAWVLSCVSLTPDEATIRAMASRPELLGDGMVVETHYMLHGCFLREDELLEGCKGIEHIPCTIVHGRYDMLCPPVDAWRLHVALPSSKLVMVPESGHSSSMAPRLRSAVVAAINGGS